MILTLLLVGPFLLSDQLFNQISDALHLGDDIYIITTLGGDYHAHLYDAAADAITTSIIRNGGGPEEARGIEHVADCGDGTIVFMSAEGKVLHYTTGLELIAEHQTIYMSTNSLHCRSGRITLGYTSFFRSEQLSTDEWFITGVSFDLDEISEVREIRLRGSDLYLGPHLRFNNIPIGSIHFFAAQTADDTYLIAIKGSPVIYLKRDDDDEPKTYKFTNETLSRAGHVEMRRNGYYGQRSGGVNLSCKAGSNSDGKGIRFFFGADDIHRTESEVMPFGFVEVNTKNGLDISYNLYDDGLQNKLSELEQIYTTVEGERTTLLYNAFKYNANYLYVGDVFD